MRRRTLILGSASLLAGSAGCLGNLAESTPSGGSNPNNPTRTIRVQQTGEIAADPDMARVEVAIEAIDEDAESVRAELAERSDAVYEALIDFGIDDDAITTGRFNIRQRYDERAMQEDGVTPRSESELADYRYYVGTHPLRLELDDIEAVGEVIDAAVAGGADTVERVQFGLSDERRVELREDALATATDQARAEAEFVANELGVSVSEPKTIDTSGGTVSPVRAQVEMADDAVDDAPPTTVRAPDDVTVAASIEVVFELG